MPVSPKWGDRFGIFSKMQAGVIFIYRNAKIRFVFVLFE